ncbi:MAG TPA: hypothetical protein VGM29_03770 [Polyangiaceae bacterium]|jgi:hypothetical protein
MRRLGARVLALALLLASSAWADGFDAALRRAVAAKELALDHDEPAAWLETLRAFQDADAIHSTPETKYELGGAAAHLKQADLAVESYEAAVALGLQGAALSHAQEYLAQNAANMAHVSLRGSAGAEVRVDGAPRGRLPLARPLTVFAGAVKLEVVELDGTRQARALTLRAQETQELDLSVGPLAANAAPPSATNSTANAAPPSATNSTPAQSATPSAPIAGWVLLVSGGAVLTAGVVLLPVAQGKLGDARGELAGLCLVRAGSDACTTPQTGQRDAAQSQVDRIATWKAWRAGAWAGVGTGAALATTGLLLVLGRHEDRPSAQVGVVSTNTEFGLNVAGTF